MNSLKTLSDTELLARTRNLATEERRSTTEVLRHLREVERRQLFAVLGFSSLYEYCVDDLKYSEAAAYRRISTMRLMKEIPEIEGAINEGKLSVTNVSSAQSFFLAEKKEKGREFSKQEKVDLLKSLEGRSRRDCDRIFAALSQRVSPMEVERAISPTETEIRFVANQDLMSKFVRVRELTAHREVGPSYSRLFDFMSDAVLERIDPVRKYPTKNDTLPPPAEVTVRYISATLRRAVWKRDEGCCTYVDPGTGRKCTSRYRLEIDHIKPYSVGGTTELENLRLLCRTHNQLKAIKTYGMRKMRPYLAGAN